MTCESLEPFDIVVVPFPFTDKEAAKRRPAVVLSSREFNDQSGHVVLAMITSSQNPPWPLDVEIHEIQIAGLKAPSKIRMKIFTLDKRFILYKIGKLSEKDKENLKFIFKNKLFSW